MNNEKFFDLLDLDRLKENVQAWVKIFPCISKIALFKSPEHVKDISTLKEVKGEKNFEWEYKFAFIVTVTDFIGPLEKNQESIWDYYNAVGDGPGTWPLTAVFLDSYSEPAISDIYDWRWVNVRQEEDHADDIIGFWADRHSSVVLFDSGHDKRDLEEQYIKNATKYFEIKKNETGQNPTEKEVEEYIKKDLLFRKQYLGKQEESRLPKKVFRRMYKAFPLKRKRGEKNKKI